MKFERILVPVDFSPSSAKAVQYARELAAVFASEIHLLHCYMTNPGSLSPYAPGLSGDVIDSMRDAAAAELEGVTQPLKAAGIRVQEHLSDEYPSLAICRSAKDLEANVIVMGTKGTSGLKHVLLGSVAERTLRIAPCPVLTVGEDHD
jgi:universal stress protein A